MEITKLCYELYKLDWEQTHEITTQHKKASMIDYYKGLANGDYDEEYTYDEYINDCGYNGELYVCYDEFLDSEYLDEEYILALLNGDINLIKLYYRDIYRADTSPQRVQELYDNMLNHISELVSRSDLVDTLHAIGFTDEEIIAEGFEIWEE
jgi:hypothetical protein